MRPEPAFSAASLGLVLGPAIEAGVSPSALLLAAGLDDAALERPDARVPFSAVRLLWLEAERRSGLEAYGVRAAQLASHALFDVLAYLVRASPTIVDAFERISRYARLTSEPTRFDVWWADDALVVRHRVEGVVGEVPAPAAECMLALTVSICRQLLGNDTITPVEVKLRGPATKGAAALARFFRAPIAFDADQNEVVLPAEVAEASVATADPKLLTILEEHADRLLAQLPTDDTFRARVHRLVCDAFRDGAPTLGGAAQRLRVSRRTLQRRLQDDGTTFEAILDDVRRALALEHVATRATPLAEVAFLLGFGDVSAFHRAFRRWTGGSPGGFRAARRRA